MLSEVIYIALIVLVGLGSCSLGGFILYLDGDNTVVKVMSAIFFLLGIAGIALVIAAYA